MSGGAFWAILSATFKQTMRSKWLIMFTIVFALFAFNLPIAELQWLGILPPNYDAFYMGTLITNSFILVPLLGLPLGAVSIVEERESGSLGYLLSTRVSRAQFLMAKASGLLAATSAIIVLGFAIAVYAAHDLNASAVQLVSVTIAAIFLNASVLGLSLVISTLSRKRLTAHSVAILVWFIFVYSEITQSLNNPDPFLSGGAAYAAQLPWIYLNPVVMGKVLALMQVPYAGLEDIGAAGLALQYFFGANTINALYELMGAWVIITLAIAYVIFRFQDIR